jgi:hypothetical protein
MNYDLHPIPHPSAGGPRVNSDDRESLIGWLCWNDRHGIYRDEDSLLEGYGPITLEAARELYVKQAYELGAYDYALEF